MVIFGVILMVLGAILCGAGYNMNNDIEAQMESLFENGKTNPGDPMIGIGALVFIVGVVLLIVGLSKNNKAKGNYNYQNTTANMPYGGAPNFQTPPQPVVQPTVYCPNCGNAVQSGSAFCNKCGSDLQQRPQPTQSDEHIN